MNTSFVATKNTSNESADTPGKSSASASDTTPSEEMLISLPECNTLVYKKDRRAWRGFLSRLKSLDQLVGHKGLYPWYKAKSPKMKVYLKRHIAQNLPLGSIERFRREIYLEAMRFLQKYQQIFLDEGFILAETRKLDDDTSVVVKIPRSELACVVHRMLISGRTNPEIAQILGLSLDTVEKLNREKNVAATLEGDVEGSTIEEIREITSVQLLREVRKGPKAKTAALLQVLKWCDQREKKAKIAQPGSDDSEETQRKRIAQRHRERLEKSRASYNDEQSGPVGGPEDDS